MFRPALSSVLAIFLQLNGLYGQVHDGVELVRASLIADATAFEPGKVTRLGVLLDLAPGWHVYWRNPGDAGLATSLEWQLPDGFVAGEIEWPVPKRIIEPGDLQVFGYKEQVLLTVPISVPASASLEEVQIGVRATWLVCEAICVPGEAELELSLPVANASAPANAALFDRYTKHLPEEIPQGVEIDWKRTGENWILQVAGAGDTTVADFYPFEALRPEPGHTVFEGRDGDSLLLRIPSAGKVSGLLVLGESDRVAWAVSSPEPSSASGMDFSTTSAGAPGGGLNLWTALLYGMLGGLILNLMPCVLPVISLKIFGFIRQAGESPGRIFRHGLAFGGGMFVWFLGLAVVISLLRLAGDQVTWAFQFQNPWFILFISVVVFVFALNLFGVFEIVLPGSATTKLSDMAGKEGYSGSFFQGIFATLLATPCTAPFLGTALGFAFAQPTYVIFAMFASVAFGMAFPYLILSARPGWIGLLPKPGTWMERLKQFMGFPLIATLLWLLSVLGGQKGLAGVIWAASLLACLAFACWLYGAFCLDMSGGRRGKWIAGLAAVVVAVGGSWFFGGLFARSTPPVAGGIVEREGAIAWQPFSESSVNAYLAEGRPVFIDFTADWCLTCKFNERTAINTPAVRKRIEEEGIIPIKADWTNANPEITAWLKKFGRVGVPFYLFYPRGDRSEPVIFPELITERMVLDGLSGGTFR
jgi:thiol:disulfide interchange protein/DsbC/DsbD-like thiol-disulfide interchange protein